MKVDDKISRMKKALLDIDYLNDEYEKVKLWGDCPDGDLKFNKFMIWLAENEHLVTHMIKVSKEIHDI